MFSQPSSSAFRSKRSSYGIWLRESAAGGNRRKTFRVTYFLRAPSRARGIIAPSPTAEPLGPPPFLIPSTEDPMTSATAPASTASQAPVRVRQTKMLIDGKWVDSVSGRTFETINPATGEVIAHVAE